MPKNDEFTLSLLINDEALAVNQNSTNNRQLFNTNSMVAWTAEVPGSKDKYVALFNRAPEPPARARRGGPGDSPAPAATNATPMDATATQPKSVSVSLAEIGFTGPVKIRDLWNHQDLGAFSGTFAPEINSHGAGLYRVHPAD